MPEWFYSQQLQKGPLTLDREESHHAVRVMRLKQGDELFVTDGNGGLGQGVLQEPDPKKCVIDLHEISTQPRQKINFHLAVSPPKSTDRLEWMIEKCVELGVEEISFLVTERSVRRK
jgi:16S rRNA (uracil1498-N3)-methyltransferase